MSPSVRRISCLFLCAFPTTGCSGRFAARSAAAPGRSDRYGRSWPIGGIRFRAFNVGFAIRNETLVSEQIWARIVNG